MASETPRDQRKSSYELMAPETRAMQDDDTANPAMLSVLEGRTLWRRNDGAAGKSCASCHGEPEIAMKGVVARYPALDPPTRKAISLAGRINRCRTVHQSAPPWPYESKALLAVTALIARQSRGMPIASNEAALRETVEAGRLIYQRRQGQLNLACSHCHDDNAGKKLAGIAIPQGHPTAYPIYRLEWQSIGSLQRRLRNCMTGMRAAPYALGSRELVALEAYLMWRARGMVLESPGVRP